MLEFHFTHWLHVTSEDDAQKLRRSITSESTSLGQAGMKISLFYECTMLLSMSKVDRSLTTQHYTHFTTYFQENWTVVSHSK